MINSIIEGVKGYVPVSFCKTKFNNIINVFTTEGLKGIEDGQEATFSEETRVSRNSCIDKILRTTYRFENDDITLKKALDFIQRSWIPLHLDRSLAGFRNNTKHIDDHNQYFEKCIKDLLKLSLTYHSDKGLVKDDNVQVLINLCVRALRNIHSYIMKTDLHLKKECYFIYRMYNPLPLSMLCSDEEDAHKIVRISPVDGTSVLYELNLLTDMEEGYLMECRNNFLISSKVILKHMLSQIEDNRDWNQISILYSSFKQSYENYTKDYSKHWIVCLENLLLRCGKSEILKIIEDSVEILLKDSKLQYAMLVEKKYNSCPDENFILPILDYRTMIKVCYRFARKCHLTIYYYHTDHISQMSNGQRELIHVTENLVNNFITNKKDKFNEDLKNFEKIQIGEDLSNYLKIRNNTSSAEDTEVQKQLILYIIDVVIKKLEDRFVIKTSCLERQKNELKELQERVKKSEKAVEQQKKLTQDKVDEAHFFGSISSSFSRKLYISDIDDDLKRKIFEQMDSILKGITEVFIHSNNTQISSEIIDIIFTASIEKLRGDLIRQSYETLPSEFEQIPDCIKLLIFDAIK